MDIKDIINKINDGKIKWRVHASKKMIERDILKSDVIYAILNGEIIKEYPEDFPFPSCLILGYTISRVPLHIVCSIGQDILWIITVYKPDIDKWESDFKTRKEKL
jgi:hypothetical protein